MELYFDRKFKYKEKSFPLDKKMLTKLVYSDIATNSWHIMYSSVDMMRTTIHSDKSQLLKYFQLPKYKNAKYH